MRVCENGSQQTAAYRVFSTSLGWMGIAGAGDCLQRLVVGYRSENAAESALGESLLLDGESQGWQETLVGQLTDYADGYPFDFSSVTVKTDHLTAFQKRVVRHCRRIPHGGTLSYGQLAAKAGSPGAARAVGQVMATNRVAIIVPCHRVVAANGKLGGFSMPRGTEMKSRLLALEGAEAGAAAGDFS